MRPIFFFTLMIFVVSAQLAAQDPVSAAMRMRDWPANGGNTDGIGWTVFSCQYYSVSNWNSTGLAVDHSAGGGNSAVLIYRDGIPGFSWYHLYLSHRRQFNHFSGMLQLRFSMIGLKDQTPVFRLGGNMITNWTLNERLQLQVSIWDFPGWILPGTAIARGDPAMQLLIFDDPGRLIGVAGGFRIGASHFGPVTAGVRMKVNEQIVLSTLMDVLPFGVSFGVNYCINDYLIRGWVGHRHGAGVTPMVEVRRLLGY